MIIKFSILVKIIIKIIMNMIIICKIQKETMSKILKEIIINFIKYLSYFLVKYN